MQKLAVNSTTRLMIDKESNTSCYYHRVKLPFSYLKCNPKRETFYFNRIPSIGLDALRLLKIQGIRLMMDIDDHFKLPEDHYLYKSFKLSKTTEKLIECLKLADIVITSTDLLAKEVKQFNKNIVVIPNALPFDQSQFTKNRQYDKTSMVYACGASHRQDIQLLKGIENRQLTIAGYQSDNTEWAKFKMAFPSSRYQLMMPLDKYMDCYNGHKIALAPLQDNIFNNCKSNLKTLEAGAKGLVLVASKVSPYLNKLDQSYVLYAENKEDWRIITNKLIKDDIFREDKAYKLAEHVRANYDLLKVNELRKQVIES